MGTQTTIFLPKAFPFLFLGVFEWSGVSGDPAGGGSQALTLARELGKVGPCDMTGQGRAWGPGGWAVNP